MKFISLSNVYEKGEISFLNANLWNYRNRNIFMLSLIIVEILLTFLSFSLFFPNILAPMIKNCFKIRNKYHYN